MQNTIKQICSYIQKMTLNLIKTFKVKNYSTKHTNNTKIHLQKTNVSKVNIFLNLETHSNQRFPFMFMARLEIICLTVAVFCFLKFFQILTKRSDFCLPIVFYRARRIALDFNSNGGEVLLRSPVPSDVSSAT